MDNVQGIITKTIAQDTYILTWAEQFLIDRKARGLSDGSISFYKKKPQLFQAYCESRAITRIDEIIPDEIRRYLLYLGELGHNPGGIHAAYRTLRAFLRWWEDEVEPDDWKNPINKVKAPRLGLEPLEPVALVDVAALVKTCDDSFIGLRDKAILLCLLDSGCRATEFVSIDLDDINLASGSVLIRQGKGHKPRTVFLGKKSRKSVRTYLKLRTDDCSALWISRNQTRLTYDGLRAIVSKRSRLSEIAPPSLHSFRRAFAINMLRSGCDVYSLASLMAMRICRCSGDISSKMSRICGSHTLKDRQLIN